MTMRLSNAVMTGGHEPHSFVGPSRVELFVLVFVLCVSPGLALAAEPNAVSFSSGRDYFFRSDHLTSAEYLKLTKDGTYSEIDVEHMFTQVSDRGTWVGDGNRLTLISDVAVRDIQTPHYSVHIFDRCGVDLLPKLKNKIVELKAKVAGERVTSEDVEHLRIMRKAKPPLRRCGPSVTMHPGFEFEVGLADSASLNVLISAIDAYLDDRRNQNRFSYDMYSYAGNAFLATGAPGVQAVESTPASFKEAVDRESARLPSFTFVEIDKETYDRGTACTYAFKAFPSMNKPCNR
jgi:hypothetical protein